MGALKFMRYLFSGLIRAAEVIWADKTRKATAMKSTWENRSPILDELMEADIIKLQQ